MAVRIQKRMYRLGGVYLLVVLVLYNLFLGVAASHRKPIAYRHRTYAYNLWWIAAALKEYANDHLGNYPQDLRELFPKYISNPLVFWGLSDKNNFSPWTIDNSKVNGRNSAQISFTYYPDISPWDQEERIIIRENGRRGYFLNTDWEVGQANKFYVRQRLLPFF